ncbi:MAG: 4-hydroxy-tetrahydrodipicolinate synthase [Nannocystaceae bacterium]
MFSGAYTALVTPLSDHRVDQGALGRMTERQIAGGIDGLVPCGTTGESATLSISEHVRAIETVLRVADGRVPVIPGAGSNCTRSALETTRACKELGTAATLQVTPYYNKPTQEGLRRHFLEIADRVAHPMILYNVPSRTHVDLLPETTARLASHPMIIGIKDATADLHRAAQLREQCGPDFKLFSGDDFTILPFMSLGGDGVISVVSNLVPEIISNLCKAARADRWQEARDLHYRHLPLTRSLSCRSNPIPIKAAMCELGLCGPDLYPPLQPMSMEDPDGQRIVGELKQVGVLS